MKSRCDYCDPLVGNHDGITTKIEWYFQFITSFLFPPIRFFEKRIPGLWMMWRALWKLCSLIGLIKERTIDTYDALPSRSRIVYIEACALGIPMKQIMLASRPTVLFAIGEGSSKSIVEQLPLVDILRTSETDLHTVDNKYLLKKILRKYQLPCAQGEIFFNARRAFAYGCKRGFPLVAKPSDGSLSMHVICNIRTPRALQEAIAAVFQISPKCIIEEHIAGSVFRATLVRGRLVACCMRESPNVIGDGVHTIRELIERKNIQRAASRDIFSPLQDIVMTPLGEAFLASQKYSQDTIPLKQQKVYLHPKVLLASGADIHDVTDEMHPDMRALCERLATQLNVAVLGIDLMCADISRSPSVQQCAILEANTLPAIEMHHYPSTGKPRNVARILLEASQCH